MRHIWIAVALIAVVPSTLMPVHGSQTQTAPKAPVVVFTTVKGVIEIETFPSEAPKSVERFLSLAKRGFYRGTRFHWVQPGVIQGGDQLSRDMTKIGDWGRGGSGTLNATRPIGVAEIGKRKLERGTVGLAYRQGQTAEDADCQIFILKIANPALNGKYAAIGRVIKGMAVVDKIAVEDMIKDVSIR